jgi:GGDEF domain-containing protein
MTAQDGTAIAGSIRLVSGVNAWKKGSNRSSNPHEGEVEERVMQLAQENRSLRAELEGLRRELRVARSVHEGVPPGYEIGVFAEPYMRPRLREEICRAGRYRHYLSMVMIQLVPRVAHNEDNMDLLPRRYIRRIRDLLRATDILFLLRGGRITIILPETSQNETNLVIERLRNLVNGETKMACAVASYPQDANHEALLISEATERLDRLIASWRP